MIFGLNVEVCDRNHDNGEQLNFNNQNLKIWWQIFERLYFYKRTVFSQTKEKRGAFGVRLRDTVLTVTLKDSDK